jgi:hypothetical protein
MMWRGLSSLRVHGAFLSRVFPRFGTGDWKVALTRRQECLRYIKLATLTPAPLDGRSDLHIHRNFAKRGLQDFSGGITR